LQELQRDGPTNGHRQQATLAGNLRTLVVGFRHRRFVPTLLEDPHGRSLYYTVVNGARQTTATREADAEVGFSSVTTSALRSDAWRSAAKIEPGASVK
jgi:hypothetical protein